MGLDSSIVAGLVLLCVTGPSQAAVCSQRAMKLCLQPMIQSDLATGRGIVPAHSVETMRAICEKYEEVRKCLTRIYASCPPELQVVFTSFAQSYYYICDEAFDDYIQYQECLSTPMLQTDGRHCLDTATSSLGGISPFASLSIGTSLICGYTTTYITCVHDVVEEYCGSDAADWQEKLDIHTFGPALDYTDCPLFDGYLFVWHDVFNTSDGTRQPRNALTDDPGAIIGIILAVLFVLIIVNFGLSRCKISRKRSTPEERLLPVHTVTSSGGPPSHPSVRYEHGGAMTEPYLACLSISPPYTEKEALYDTPDAGDAALSLYSEPPPYAEAVGNSPGGPEVVYYDTREPTFAFENMTYSG